MEGIHDYRILKVLGRGSFATVYLAVKNGEQTKVAIKKISLKEATDKDKKNAINEVRLLSSIDSQYIIGFRSAFYDQTTEQLYVVMEYAGKTKIHSEKGDLAQKIERCITSDLHIPETQIWTILQHVAKGLSHLHANGILHRDLKTANVFQTRDGRFKIADFNVSKRVEKEGGLADTQIGTPYYASPEVWENSKYGSKTDIWSLGIMAYELAALRMPFPAKTINELYVKINKGKYDRIPSIYSEGLSELITNMLSSDPLKRPSSQEIVACSVLNKFDIPTLTVKPSNQRKVFASFVHENPTDPEIPTKQLTTRKEEGRGRLSSLRGYEKNDRKGISLLSAKENANKTNNRRMPAQPRSRDENISRMSNRTEKVEEGERSRRTVKMLI